MPICVQVVKPNRVEISRILAICKGGSEIKNILLLDCFNVVYNVDYINIIK